MHNKAILLHIGKDVSVQFIDLTSGKIEPTTKYSKIKVQLYQFPKLILSIIKRNYLLLIPLILLIILVYLRSVFYKNDE